MPFIIIAFLVLIFHRRPGDFVRGLFTAGVVASVFFMLILFPGTVKGFFVNLLSMRGQNVLNAVGQFTLVAIGHGNLRFKGE